MWGPQNSRDNGINQGTTSAGPTVEKAAEDNSRRFNMYQLNLKYWIC